jgi:LacI family transcriptional regulator
MRDVARMAGVSLSTVSRVVGGQQVAPDMADRVRRAVELLGYRHDAVAGSLRSSNRASSSIGLILEDVSNPFFAAIHRGAEDVARERAVVTFAGSSDEQPERERQIAEAFLARRVDGLVIAPASTDHGYLVRDVDAGLAIVFVDRPPQFIDADAVVTDNVGGARAAVAHLLEVGHRRIAFIGDDPEIFTAAQRLEGYRLALSEAGIPADAALIRHVSFRAVDAADVLDALLSAPVPPTALFTAQNLITVETMRRLHELGLQRSLAHVGFDDVPLADVVEPGVTVVAQDPYAMGRQAAELLFSRLGGDAGPSRRVVLPARLVERGSGRIPPAAN